MFKGSYVALVTPLLANGDIDNASLEALVQWHIESGTHGIVAVGTTGESATLPMDEHIDVVRQIVHYADGQVPIIAGSGANSTEEAIFLTKEMAKLSVDGFLSVVPYYNKPQQRGIIAHFEAIAEASDLPTILYNVPSRTVTDMSTDTVAALAKHPNIVGLKDATGDLSRLAETKQAVHGEFVNFSGDDASGCEFMCNGGDGVISVSANIAPHSMAQMCKHALAGDLSQAREFDAVLTELHHDLFIEPNPVIPKWALFKMGRINSPMLRLPMVLPELNSQKQIEQRLFQLGLIR
ncbi:4-hydroxy-tetrahydrodipicolinate synthase [Glaciecola siphonariae]|uniref:4-hydroxy-tetrahydrodipicolinate synthase n=1 Tax=Glaciecola siphonariae TaxID=521012 RepID=A0ABV9LTI4_9ALTE